MTETLEYGVFAVDTATRKVRGILIPYNELSRTSKSKTKPLRFAKGGVKVPRDVSIVGLNRRHNQFDPFGRAAVLDPANDSGVYAEFMIADTPEGDAWLADHGDLVKLSAEVRNIVRLDDGEFATAEITGAALVEEGAFETAGLFAIDDSDPEPTTPTDPAPAVAETTTTTTQEEEHPVTVPTTLDAGPVTTTTPAPTTIVDVAHALAAFSARGDRSLLDAIAAADQPRGESGMFALSDVKITTAGSVGVNIVQPQWIGQLWEGRSYLRRIIPLIASDTLKSFKVQGFRWTTKPVMAEWAGDKAAIPSNAPATEPYALSAKRYAGGHDIAREYRDFDVPEFWDAYFKAMTESYAKLTDDAALTALVAGATAVTAGAVPAGVNSGLVSIVDGALAVLPVGVPTFAVVAPDVFRGLALMKDIDKLAFLNAGLGLEEGTIASFKVVPHPGMAAGKALVGVKNAATSYELPGSPIRTEALDQIKGGIDEALFGYAAVGVDNPAGIALVTPAA